VTYGKHFCITERTGLNPIKHKSKANTDSTQGGDGSDGAKHLCVTDDTGRRRNSSVGATSRTTGTICTDTGTEGGESDLIRGTATC